jgi:hypothetical protein
MLKIWKRTWKQTDPSNKPPGGPDSGKEGTLDGLRSDASSSLDAVEATPPSDFDLHPVLPPGGSNSKRPRKDVDQEPSPSNPPSKKARPSGRTNHDSIGNHLPEINEADIGQFAPRSLAVFRDQVMEHAQRENSKYNPPPFFVSC